jgi:hypothetical protein
MPFSYANGKVGLTYFEVIESMPERSKNLSEAMADAVLMGLDEAVAGYSFNRLEANPDGIYLVDIGGGKGHALNSIATAYPMLKGKMALQDLRIVLDGGVLVEEKNVIVQPFDFFNQIEPIKGATYCHLPPTTMN